MKKTNTDLTLAQCDELRGITESIFTDASGRPLSDEQFESKVEAIAGRCGDDFSAENWKRNC
jgi:hypothetical protein